MKVHWYGIMYLLGFAAGWWLGRHRAAQPNSTWKPSGRRRPRLLPMLGGILGGRIGYVLFYGLAVLGEQPVVSAAYLGRRHVDPRRPHRRRARAHPVREALTAACIGDVFDFTVPLPGLGIMFGRIGNFINGELWGKPTDMPWGFNYNGKVLHPSQLYEALLEGLAAVPA